ncbi:hypothetical protein IGI04_006995 [Brassica rapa subsp. trilocularis]|uniref:Uncharacterized protein n=1 Tax=Brassica rapa subsp. trilocularis TaxID=1813537 RepID=A0ABQ7NKK7_BRACM|nr:hypothetical protein IGI04_006995 [Brassica rapa subsp. trilocularis]
MSLSSSQFSQTSVPGVCHSTFESLRLGRSSHSIASGLLRFWDSLNFKKDMEFMESRFSSLMKRFRDSWVYSCQTY